MLTDLIRHNIPGESHLKRKVHVSYGRGGEYSGSCGSRSWSSDEMRLTHFIVNVESVADYHRVLFGFWNIGEVCVSAFHTKDCNRLHGHYLVKHCHYTSNLSRILRKFVRGQYKNVPIRNTKHLKNVIEYILRIREREPDVNV